MQECMRKYDRNLYLQFDQTFRQLPLATIIDGATLVVHAGIDDDLTVAKLGAIFTLVNSLSEEEEDGDDDEEELVYEEFLQVLARMCDAKIPAAQRNGMAFEYTLQAWIQLQFLPVYKNLLKLKARGVASKTM